MQEVLILAVFEFILGYLVAVGLYQVTYPATLLPIGMTLTAKQNVRMSLELHDRYLDQDIGAMATSMLETVGLGERSNYYPESLSGGQKQRVAIVRALISQPKIVLADEPTAALDKKSGRDVVELMQKLAKEQTCTILLVTHDNRILNISDRIIYMEDGRLVNNRVDVVGSVK